MSNSGFNLPGGLKVGPLTIDATTGAITTSGNVRVTGGGTFVGTNAPGTGGGGGSSNVKLLLNMNGTNDSTTFTDSSAYANTITAYGDAKLKTAEKKYGTASAYFDGLGIYGSGPGGQGTNMSRAYLTVPSSADLDLTGDFTIEFWLKPNNLTSNAGILHRGYFTVGSGWANSSYSIRRVGNFIRFYFYCSGATEQYVDVTIPNTNWHHWAMVKDGTTAKVYLDGVLAGTRATTSNSLSSTRDLKIGLWDYTSGSNFYEYLGGYIDDVRIIKGQAVYTTNFTPPGAELTTTI